MIRICQDTFIGSNKQELLVVVQQAHGAIAQFGGRGNKNFSIFIKPFVGVDAGSSESQTA